MNHTNTQGGGKLPCLHTPCPAVVSRTILKRKICLSAVRTDLYVYLCFYLHREISHFQLGLNMPCHRTNKNNKTVSYSTTTTRYGFHCYSFPMQAHCSQHLALKKSYNPGQKCWDTCTFSLKTFPFRFPPPPSPYQSWISGLKVHFFGATLTRGEGGRHFAQTRPSRVSKTERLANTCHIFRLSQGLLSRIVGTSIAYCDQLLFSKLCRHRPASDSPTTARLLRSNILQPPCGEWTKDYCCAKSVVCCVHFVSAPRIIDVQISDVETTNVRLDCITGEQSLVCNQKCPVCLWNDHPQGRSYHLGKGVQPKIGEKSTWSIYWVRHFRGTLTMLCCFAFRSRPFIHWNIRKTQQMAYLRTKMQNGFLFFFFRTYRERGELTILCALSWNFPIVFIGLTNADTHKRVSSPSLTLPCSLSKGVFSHGDQGLWR